MPPKEMAESIKTCTDIDLGYNLYRNGWTGKIVEIQCCPIETNNYHSTKLKGN